MRGQLRRLGRSMFSPPQACDQKSDASRKKARVVIDSSPRARKNSTHAGDKLTSIRIEKPEASIVLEGERSFSLDARKLRFGTVFADAMERCGHRSRLHANPVDAGLVRATVAHASRGASDVEGFARRDAFAKLTRAAGLMGRTEGASDAAVSAVLRVRI